MLIYKGPSRLDPSQTIVAILTFESANTKTGPMAQLFIMHADVAPHTAQKTGHDAAVCGDCPFRPALKTPGVNACYVRTFQGPRSTWEAHRHSEVELARALAQIAETKASVRLGAYGDPAALPPDIIASLASAADGRVTGYTHQWRAPHAAHLRPYVMASCDDVTHYARAKAEGWRTFRVIQKRSLPVLAKREIECPSDKGVQCIDCLLCDGASYGPADRRKDIAIAAH